MPFINGRYYINPVMGEALEAAREAHAALAALENRAHEDDAPGYEAPDSSPKTSDGGPIHRVEIEAAEVVPSHSGRAAGGFVARVHRQPINAVSGDGSRRISRGAGTDHAETHVFNDHRDLISFLRDELGRDELREHSRSHPAA
jgi:hypothetical protein